MTDTSERERQINEIDRAIAAAFGAFPYLVGEFGSHAEAAQEVFERWRRADAETIRQLRQDKEEILNMLRDVSDNRERYKERCAAQSAELERVTRRYVRDLINELRIESVYWHQVCGSRHPDLLTRAASFIESSILNPPTSPEEKK